MTLASLDNLRGREPPGWLNLSRQKPDRPRRMRVLAASAVLFIHAAIIAILSQSPLGRLGDTHGLGRKGGESLVSVALLSRPIPLTSPATAPPAPVKPPKPVPLQAIEPPQQVQADHPAGVASPQGVASAASAGSNQADRASANAIGDAPDIAAAFEQQLLAHIQAYRHYPDEARSSMASGVVQVLFAMDRMGAVTGVWIQQSSGSPILDREAVATVLRAQPLPPIPDSLPDPLNISLPVSFGPPS